MSLLDTINNPEFKNKEQWIPIQDGSGCYLVVAKRPSSSKRFVGKVTINKKTYKQPLGTIHKKIKRTDLDQILSSWIERKNWAISNKCDPKKFDQRNTLNRKSKTFKEICDLFLQWKKEHLRDDAFITIKNRLNQICKRLPDEILIEEFAGFEGRQFLKERVIDPSVNNDHPYTAMRHRRLLNNVFDFAETETFLHPELLPYNLHKPFSFEKNIKKSTPHPHLNWEKFKDLIKNVNSKLDTDGNPVKANRLTDLAVKASFLMMIRVSVVVSLRWDMFDEKNKVWRIPPDTKGLKRKFGDDLNYHLIPQTPQLEVLMNNLWAINGQQDYVFFSNNSGNNPYLSRSTPNDHLKNLGYGGIQDIHGLRHTVTNALVDVKGMDERNVSRCLGHLRKDGAIASYDFAERLKQRREIHEEWNSMLVKEGGLLI